MATHSSILAWRINPMDSAAWQAAIHRVPKSRTRPKQLNTGTQTAMGLRHFFGFLRFLQPEVLQNTSGPLAGYAWD